MKIKVLGTTGTLEFRVCVTEQHYVLIFCTRLWHVRTALIQIQRILKFQASQLRMRGNTKTKR